MDCEKKGIQVSPCMFFVTFKEELLNDCLSFCSIQVYHSHLCTSFTQSVSECSAYALSSACHIGHLTVKTHSIQDETPCDPTENLIICNFTLMNENKQADVISKYDDAWRNSSHQSLHAVNKT